MSNASGTMRILKTIKSWAFCKKRWVSEKSSKFSKLADGNKFAVECELISKVSQNVYILGFGSIKEYFGFSIKTEVF